MTTSNQKKTALYCRLSQDDNTENESNSIQNQKMILQRYASDHHFPNPCFYVDDGYSGASFQRPGFQQMMADMENGEIGIIITKDLSRLGRNQLHTGLYIEERFPMFGVRYIAINDNVDTDSSESNELMPFKNLFNEWYVRDSSRKVRAVFRAKAERGERLGARAPYGYRRSEDDRNRLVVDDEAAAIVRRIFAWKIEGMAVSAIAKKLNGLHILSPREYKKSLGLNFRGGFTRGGTSEWSSPSVRRILTNEVYLGHLVQGRTERINYKVKKCVEKPAKEWIRVENTHEPIVSADDFAIVQNLLKADGRISPEKKEISPFMGLLFCGDCREQMVRRVNRYKGTEKIYYICSTKNRGEGCSRHSIEEAVLRELAGTAYPPLCQRFSGAGTAFAQAKKREANLQAVISYNKEIARLKKEQDKYYSLCAGLYEDLGTGVITREEFERLHGEFQKKAESLAARRGKTGAACQGDVQVRRVECRASRGL